MPNCLFYADNKDLKSLLTRLNNDPEVAFILPDGKSRWIARNLVNELDDGRYYLWHIPSGKLPLFKKGNRNIIERKLRKHMGIPKHSAIEAGLIKNPFEGWKALCAGANPKIPFFGSSPKVLEFCVQTQGTETVGSIGLSSLGWIGNRYSAIGNPASEEMVKWWRKIKQWISKNTINKIPRRGSLDGTFPEIWTFPSAYSQIEEGIPRDVNPPY